MTHRFFCATPGYTAHVERRWLPPESLAIELRELPSGGSAVFTEEGGRLLRLQGRLDPVLDNLDRMYLYANNVTIDEGKQQPVHFKLKQPLRLTDVGGVDMSMRFIEMIGTTALLEYLPSGEAFPCR